MTGPIRPPFTAETAAAEVQFAPDGLMRRRYASVNDVRIREAERQIHQPER
jgi:nuclear transport factor 2 (NTF2) superfamily protein